MHKVAELFRTFVAPAGAEANRLRNANRLGNAGHAPRRVSAPGLAPFRIDAHLQPRNGFPLLDWDAVQAWLEPAASEDVRAVAWTACERAWLLHLREVLGEGYSLDESGLACLLSTYDPASAAAALAWMNRALVRVERVLHGIARIPERGREILIVFDDAVRYREYVSCYGPGQEMQFVFRHATHIQAACSHHAMVRGELALLEPVIAHEIAHGCLAHLPLPLWLNEGLALTAQRRLAAGGYVPAPGGAHEMRLAFRGAGELQEFWSGASFRRGGEPKLRSYELARLLVERLAQDWPRFTGFVLHAEQRDAGSAAAREHLGADLGGLACSLLGAPPSLAFAPDPGRWQRGQPPKIPLSFQQ